MADVAASLKNWSTTASSNSPTDATTVGAGLADNLQQIQATVRNALAHKGSDIASASTADLGAVEGLFHDITGTTTITGFGTVSAGIWKVIKFEGALTLTHNASSLIIPGAANITTADGDMLMATSEGSGNWRVNWYTRANGEGIKVGANGADIASDSTIVLDTSTGDCVDVTGTTTITAITLASGRTRIVRFTGALTLTHGSSLVLPGAANITTAAGDYAIFRGYGSGVVRCVNYQRASGLSILSESPLILLSSQTASSDATIDFTSDIDSTYELYEVHCIGVLPSTDAQVFRMRTSTNGGSSFDSGASDYASPAGNASSFPLTGTTGVGSSSVRGVNAIIKLFDPSSAREASWTSEYVANETGGSVGAGVIGGKRNTGANVDAIQFFFTSGNIASGTFRLYGRRKP